MFCGIEHFAADRNNLTSVRPRAGGSVDLRNTLLLSPSARCFYSCETSMPHSGSGLPTGRTHFRQKAQDGTSRIDWIAPRNRSAPASHSWGILLAERMGFEPTRRLNTVYSLSRGAPSTTRPPLHLRRCGVFPAWVNPAIPLGVGGRTSRKLQSRMQKALPEERLRSSDRRSDRPRQPSAGRGAFRSAASGRPSAR